MTTSPDAWTTLRADLASVPGAEKAIERAQALGLDPDTCTGFTAWVRDPDPAQLPRLYFTGPDGERIDVTPVGAERITPINGQLRG